jgi:hypothetical protein
MIIDSKGRHVDRHYVILPSPTFFLCEFGVANPLNCFTTRKRLDFISDSQLLHETISQRSRNLRTLQKAAVVVAVAVTVAVAVAVIVFCRCGLSR